MNSQPHEHSNKLTKQQRPTKSKPKVNIIEGVFNFPEPLSTKKRSNPQKQFTPNFSKSQTEQNKLQTKDSFSQFTQIQENQQTLVDPNSELPPLIEEKQQQKPKKLLTNNEKRISLEYSENTTQENEENNVLKFQKLKDQEDLGETQNKNFGEERKPTILRIKRKRDEETAEFIGADFSSRLTELKMSFICRTHESIECFR
jgi:hypothetical protein